LKETFLPSFFQNQYNSDRLYPFFPLIQYLNNRDRRVVYDPLTPPERRTPINQYPYFTNYNMGYVNDLINYPTRGYPENYQMLGMLSRNSDEQFIQLYGRPTFPGSNQWEYYCRLEKNGFVNKIPIQSKNGKEITDGDIIKVPGMDSSKGEFKVSLYNYNTPRYNPYDY
jgi:hypothetical protein